MPSWKRWMKESLEWLELAVTTWLNRNTTRNTVVSTRRTNLVMSTQHGSLRRNFYRSHVTIRHDWSPSPSSPVFFYIFHSGCRQHVGNTTQIVQPIQTVGVCLVEGERGFSRLTLMAGSTDWKTAFNTRNVWLPRTAFENSHVGYVNRSNFWTNLKDCLNIPWCEYFSKVEHKLNLSETVWMSEEPTSQIEFLSDFLWSLAHGIWSHTLTSVTSVTSDLL